MGDPRLYLPTANGRLCGTGNLKNPLVDNLAIHVRESVYAPKGDSRIHQAG
jgi:hypothetical protein